MQGKNAVLTTLSHAQNYLNSAMIKPKDVDEIVIATSITLNYADTQEANYV